MTATMRDPGSSVNPLHPRMAEVQAIAAAYVGRCLEHAADGGLPDDAEASLPSAEVAPHPGQSLKEGTHVDPAPASCRDDRPQERTQPRCTSQQTGQGLQHGAEAGRGTKRPLPTGIGCQGSTSDLMVIRGAPAPYMCDVSVKVKAHFPSKVKFWHGLRERTLYGRMSVCSYSLGAE